MLPILHVVGQEFAELGLWNLGHLHFPILYCQMRNHLVSCFYGELPYSYYFKDLCMFSISLIPRCIINQNSFRGVS